MHITNPSILNDPAFDNDYVERIILNAKGNVTKYLKTGDNELSIMVDIPKWRAQKHFDPEIDSTILLLSLGGMLRSIPNDGDSFLGVLYSFANRDYNPGNLVGYIHPSAQKALANHFPIGESAMQHVGGAMMLPFEHELKKQLRDPHYISERFRKADQEYIGYSNKVCIWLEKNSDFQTILPTFTTQGDATNWTAQSRFNSLPTLLTHNLDHHYQVLSYILGAAALTEELILSSQVDEIRAK